jgi:rare lipoprotein A
MNQQFAQMSRTLNQLLERTPLEKIDIRPVVDGQQFRIQAQQRPLLQINAQLASGHQKGQLDFLLDTTNKLRRSFGNKPLRTFDRLQAHHLKGTIGYASWYGGHFHGRRTANGERYDIHKLTAAHPRLPFGTKVLVTSLDTKQSVIVKINDRGPFVGHRLIDLSPAAFDAIGALGQGVMKVHLKILG